MNFNIERSRHVRTVRIHDKYKSDLLIIKFLREKKFRNFLNIALDTDLSSLLHPT